MTHLTSPTEEEARLIEAVAESLRSVFRSSVAEIAEKPFEQTRVEMPSDEIWRRYAEAAIHAITEAVPLWCVHVRGPDDVLAMPSYEATVEACDNINEFQGKIWPEDEWSRRLVRAYPAVWTWSSKKHAKDLKRGHSEYGIPRYPPKQEEQGNGS